MEQHDLAGDGEAEAEPPGLCREERAHLAGVVRRQPRPVVVDPQLDLLAVRGRPNLDAAPGAGASGDWPEKLRPYYHDRGALTLCPSAKKPYTDGGKVPFGAWRWQTQGGGWTNFEDKPGADYGSYGMNEWLSDRPDERCWRQREQKQARNIPLFLDCAVWDTWPSHTQGPPPFDGVVELPNEMHLVCLNRHDGIVNTVFLDLNARKVDLKELWTFNWNRQFDIHGPCTKAGGAAAQDWPQWMSNMRDY